MSGETPVQKNLPLRVGHFLLPNKEKFPTNQICANFSRCFRCRRLFGYDVAFVQKRPNSLVFLGNESNTCPFCRENCKADEYHLLLVCKFFRTDRERLLPQYFCYYPNLIKLDQLMNTVKIENLSKLSVLCRIICNASASITGDNQVYLNL